MPRSNSSRSEDVTELVSFAVAPRKIAVVDLDSTSEAATASEVPQPVRNRTRTLPKLPAVKQALPKLLARRTVALSALGIAAFVISGGVVWWGVGKAVEPSGAVLPAAVTAPQPAQKIDPATAVRQAAGITNDEVPETYAVKDKAAITQPFLADAENGDKVFLFYQARKAVVYRPSNGAVVKVGDFTPPPPDVVIRQGHRLAKTDSSKKILTAKSGEYTVKATDKSTRQTYNETLVIGIKKQYSDRLDALAAAIKGRVAELPEGEPAPEADILVITGYKR